MNACLILNGESLLDSTWDEQMKNAKNSSSFSSWLDFIRWASALQVVFFHTHHRLFEKISEVPHASRSIGIYTISALSSFGGPAVLIFFILSGYLVGGRTLNRYLETGSFSIVEYASSRLSRLWTVLIPSIIVVYILNNLSIYYFDGNMIYNREVAEQDLSGAAHVAACNLVFMQLVLCPTFGDNGALWSLFHEFWYYVSFPLIMFAVWGNISTEKSLIMLCLAASLLFILAVNQSVGPNIAGYFAMWMLGVAIARSKKPIAPGGTSIALALFGCSLLAWRTFIATGGAMPNDLFSTTTAWDFAVGIAFVNLIISMKHNSSLPAPPLGSTNRYLAEFSFSLYVIHTPVINLFVAVSRHIMGVGPNIIPTTVGHYLMFFSCISLCVSFSWLFSIFTERNTFRIRRFLMEYFTSNPAITRN